MQVEYQAEWYQQECVYVCVFFVCVSVCSFVFLFVCMCSCISAHSCSAGSHVNVHIATRDNREIR